MPRIKATSDIRHKIIRLQSRHLGPVGSTVDLCKPCWKWFFAHIQPIDHDPYNGGDCCAICETPLKGEE